VEFDLVVKNGRLVDGSGRPEERGDVGVVDGRIVEVGELDGTGRTVIDADGLVVAPGFVDGHTHMDAQLFWDQLGKSSCWHGVTTAVIGNCGFTLAPAQPEERSLVVRNLERAEDIPADALAQGIDWTWATFGEYLDAVDGRPKGLNYAASVGHSALRTWAMGERAFEEPATDEDLAVMKRELSDALRAGAVGLTTSRSPSHATPDGRPVASRVATWDEVIELVSLVGRESSAAFEIAPERAARGEPAERAEYYGRLQDLAVSTGVPIMFGVAASAEWLPGVDAIEETVARGGRMYGLTHSRGATLLQSFRTHLSFDPLPEWREVRERPLDEQRVLLRDPEVRARLVRSAREGRYPAAYGAEPRPPDYEDIDILYSPYLPNPSVADEARRLGVDPVELMIDVALDTDFDVFFVQPIAAQVDTELVKLLHNPNTAMTFSDAGAHLSQITDASIQSHLLAYWVRERQQVTLEAAISMMTRQPARIWALHDRGLLAPGYAADITIFDPARVAPVMPQVVYDLPGGAPRLDQRAEGYVATIVNGEVLVRDGEPTDARSGQLLRAGRMAVPSR
jgi:N-acyl-D-aspartate/D-glutamate deacylase